MMAALTQVGARNDFDTGMLSPKFIHPDDVQAVLKFHPRLDFHESFKGFIENDIVGKPGCLTEVWGPAFLKQVLGSEKKM